MAMELVSFGIQKLWDLLSQEYEKFEGVDDQVIELKRELNLLSSFLKDADAKKHTSAVVRNCVEEIKEIVYDTEDVIETYILKEELGKKSGTKKNIRRIACIVTDRRENALDIGSIRKRISNVIRDMQSFGVQQIMALLEKIRSKMNSWTSRFLSFAGRLQLLTSVIMSLTNFWMCAFRLPKGCIQEINKLCSAFLWSGPELNHNKAKISWDSVCKPKKEGGLGIRNPIEANKVSCLKLIWRIISRQQTLWVSWIWKYIIRKECFWSANEKSSLGSWMWKKLLKYFHKVEVKNGTSTSFWFDNWCDMGRLIDITGQRGTIDLGIPLNGSIAQGKHSRRQRRHRSQILEQIENSLSSLQITDSADIHQWRHSETTFKTKFFTKNTWRLIRQSSPQVNWYKGLWFPKATPKYAFVSWLAINNRLSTGKRMKKWNTRINSECSLCKASEEDRAHLFFACSYSTKVWQKLASGVLGAAYTNQWELLQFIVNDSIIPKLKLFLLRYLLQVTVYFLWRERNSRRHGEPETPAETMIKLIDKQVRAFIASLHQDGVTYDGALQLLFYLQGY